MTRTIMPDIFGGDVDGSVGVGGDGLSRSPAKYASSTVMFTGDRSSRTPLPRDISAGVLEKPKVIIDTDDRRTNR